MQIYIIINDGKYTIRKDGGVLKMFRVLPVILIGQPYEFTVGMKTIKGQRRCSENTGKESNTIWCGLSVLWWR